MCKRHLREAQAPKGRTREAKRPAGGDRAPLRSAAMRPSGQQGCPRRGGNVRRTKGAQGAASRSPSTQRQDAGSEAKGVPRRSAAKKTVGAAGLPPLAGEMSEGQRGHKAISTTYNPSPSMGSVHSRHHPRKPTVILAKAGIQRNCPRPVHAKPSQTSTLNLPFAKRGGRGKRSDPQGVP